MPLTQAEHNTIMNQLNQWIAQDAPGFIWMMPQSQRWHCLHGANMGGVRAIYVQNHLISNPINWHISINLPPDQSCVNYANQLNANHGKIARFAIDKGTPISRINITFTARGLANLSQSLKDLEDHIRLSLRMRNSGNNGVVFGRCPKKCPGHHGNNLNPNNAHP